MPLRLALSRLKSAFRRRRCRSPRLAACCRTAAPRRAAATACLVRGTPATLNACSARPWLRCGCRRNGGTTGAACHRSRRSAVASSAPIPQRRPRRPPRTCGSVTPPRTRSRTGASSVRCSLRRRSCRSHGRSPPLRLPLTATTPRPPPRSPTVRRVRRGAPLSRPSSPRLRSGSVPPLSSATTPSTTSSASTRARAAAPSRAALRTPACPSSARSRAASLRLPPTATTTRSTR